jgi:hypothetical protein
MPSWTTVLPRPYGVDGDGLLTRNAYACYQVLHSLVNIRLRYLRQEPAGSDLQAAGLRRPDAIMVAVAMNL